MKKILILGCFLLPQLLLAQAKNKLYFDYSVGKSTWHFTGLSKVLNRWDAVRSFGIYDRNQADKAWTLSLGLGFWHNKWNFQARWNSLVSSVTVRNFDPLGRGYNLKVIPNYEFLSAGAGYAFFEKKLIRVMAGISADVGRFSWKYPEYFVYPYGEQKFTDHAWAFATTGFTEILVFSSELDFGIRFYGQLPFFKVNPQSIQEPLLLRENELDPESLYSWPINGGISIRMAIPVLNRVLGFREKKVKNVEALPE